MMKFTEEVENKTREEKAEIMKKVSKENLLELFIGYTNDYNPIDDRTIDSYEAIKSEILSRMN